MVRPSVSGCQDAGVNGTCSWMSVPGAWAPQPFLTVQGALLTGADQLPAASVARAENT